MDQLSHKQTVKLPLQDGAGDTPTIGVEKRQGFKRDRWLNDAEIQSLCRATFLSLGHATYKIERRTCAPLYGDDHE